MAVDLFRGIRFSPLPPLILIIANQFFLLCVHRNNWLPRFQRALDRAVDVPELRVPIWMISTFFRLSVALQAIARNTQELVDFRMANRMAPGRHLSRQCPGTLACPTQGRLRIAARQGFNQGVQGIQNTRVVDGQFMPSSALPANSARGQRHTLQFPNPFGERDTGQTASAADLRNAAIAQFHCFAGGHQTAGVLVKVGPNPGKLLDEMIISVHNPNDSVLEHSCKVYLFTVAYIHSSGRIYRRQEAGSDPIRENDRYTIDALYKKSLKYNEDIENFRNLELCFNNPEGNYPYIELFINTMPFNQFTIFDFFEITNWNMLMNIFGSERNIYDNDTNENAGLRISIPFDTINSYNKSVAIRCLKQHNLCFNGPTVEMDFFGNLKASLPLQQLDHNSNQISDEYKNLFKSSDNHFFEDVVVLDGMFIYGTLVGLANSYANYLSEKKYDGFIAIKMRLTNCWRTTLYIQSENLYKHIDEYGIPLCMKDEQLFPFYPFESSIATLIEKPFTVGNSLFSYAALALGIPPETALKSILDEIAQKPNRSA